MAPSVGENTMIKLKAPDQLLNRSYAKQTHLYLIHFVLVGCEW